MGRGRIFCHTPHSEDRHLFLEGAVAQTRFDHVVLNEIYFFPEYVFKLMFERDDVQEAQVVWEINEQIEVTCLCRLPARDGAEHRRPAYTGGFEDREDLDLDGAEVVRHVYVQYITFSVTNGSSQLTLRSRLGTVVMVFFVLSSKECVMAKTRDDEQASGGAGGGDRGTGENDFPGLVPRPHPIPVFAVVGLVAAALCVLVIGVYLVWSGSPGTARARNNVRQREFWVRVCGDVRCPAEQSCVITERGAMCITVNGVRTP